MNVEYTGRQFVITPAVRKQVETGLTKLTKLLGNNFETHVILIAEKRLHKAEITIHVRDNPIVGAAEANDMTSAISEAHVVRTDESVALKPMTLEEAIKECEFRDRDVFVFRDPEGRVKVLHRTKDGKLELIEAP